MVPLVKLVIGLVIAAVAFVGARLARTSATHLAGGELVHSMKPYAPSPGAAPFVSLGFREAAADVLYVRMLGHFIDEKSTGHGVADLAEAIVALDPQFHRVYERGALAMTAAAVGVDRSVYERAIDLLEAGMKVFPEDWKLPYLAGQIYTQDLQTDDPELRRAWDERGTLLVESAIRKPGAPASTAAWAALMRTKLGQHERALAGLREMLLITSDKSARERLLAALAKLEERDAAALEAEIFEERMKFERTWRADRRTIPATMYVLIGGRIEPGFDMANLATGGRDLVVFDDEAELEPVE